ncbi:hypothetical protein [Rubinisphaera margarita]|uniref:hypothetical protein n=1 Tax=Rubinisphaera margarita TaxID=2909586 RepID=UPI001EE88190|nr:hypothetical protein [Rubinisphaera margarita]MCG6155509.1 hypothetical protein [Rubinisphaera margarita]
MGTRTLIQVTPMQRLALPILSVLVLGFTPPLMAYEPAEPASDTTLVSQEVDGILVIEAEHFASQEKTDVRSWHLFDNDHQPQVTPDPDEPHLMGVSGSGYLEALPDTRTTHDDKLIKGENFFPEPGQAGVLTYRVKVTNPGRYYVWVRHFSTGTEDNGLHIGLDSQWPESGQRWQTTKKRAWAWESRQRTDKVHTGVRFQLYLDIETAGEHTIHVSMREDGFEFDKLVLARDRDYQPEGPGPKPTVRTESAPGSTRKRSPEGTEKAPIKPPRKAVESKTSAVVRPPTGRLAIVADGNSPDPDDIGAIAVIFGLLDATGLNERLVHLSHSCDLKPVARISVSDELRRQKVLDQLCKEGVDQFGPFNHLAGSFNCRTEQQAAVEDLRDAINESSENDPLWIIEAGEPDVIGFALAASAVGKRKHVHIVSHHPANDNAGDFFTWREILDFGVTEHQIGDQNAGLKTAIEPWDWAREHPDRGVRWIWNQLAYAEQDDVVTFQSGHFDCSDAGMVYWWITGASHGGIKDATPTEIAIMLQSAGTTNNRR